MNQIRQYLENFRQWILSILGKIEESPQFERVLITYDALDPRHQRRVKGAFVIAFSLIGLLIFCLPLLTVFSAKGNNAAYRSVIADMSRFNATANVVIKPAPRPAGWMSLPTSTIDDVENSMGQYFAGIGVPEDLLELTKSGDNLDVKVTEISIRQAVYFMFQVDGWFPALKFERLRVTVNPEKANLLDISAALKFDAAEGAKLQSVLGIVGGGGGGGEGFNSASGGGGDSGGDFGGGDSGSGDFDYPPPPPPPDEFSNDLPPPPPFEEDI